MFQMKKLQTGLEVDKLIEKIDTSDNSSIENGLKEIFSKLCIPLKYLYVDDIDGCKVVRCNTLDIFDLLDEIEFTLDVNSIKDGISELIKKCIEQMLNIEKVFN